MSELLRAEGVGKIYAKGPDRIEVLKGLALSVEEGQTIAIVGASGVGKSTLLHILGAIDRPTSGEVFFRGGNVFEKSSRNLARFRNESIGFVFQFHYLLPEFTAVENTAMPLVMRGESRSTAFGKARDLLEAVGLSHRLKHRPMELSGGEQQRVAVARALAGGPALILADEPTGNLDLETGRKVMDGLVSAVKNKNRSLVVATHNPELAARADRVLRLRDGALVEEQYPE